MRDIEYAIEEQVSSMACYINDIKNVICLGIRKNIVFKNKSIFQFIFSVHINIHPMECQTQSSF